MANGKLYPGGVDIATPFEMNDPQPIVSYMVVDTIANRDLLPNQFDGMDTYVVETSKKYYKSQGVWLEFAPTTSLNLSYVTEQGSSTSVTIQSPDAVNANDLVNLGQVEELISEIPTPILFTTDLSLYLDPITKELRGNIGQETENFTYTSGSQTFTLVNEPSNLIYLYVDKVPLINPLTEWSVSGNVLTILNTLSGGEKITINYQFIIT